MKLVGKVIQGVYEVALSTGPQLYWEPVDSGVQGGAISIVAKQAGYVISVDDSNRSQRNRRLIHQNLVQKTMYHAVYLIYILSLTYLIYILSLT